MSTDKTHSNNQIIKKIKSLISQDYDIIDEIASGKNGMTLKIKEKKSKQIYCLKTAKSEAITQQCLGDLRYKLEKEVSILKDLNHDCLPKIYRDGTTADIPYYVCTYHPGKTLFDIKRSGQTFTFAETIYIIGSILNVFQYLHDHGITHCDAHLDNIMLSPKPYETGLMVIDFGSGHKASHARPTSQDKGHLAFKDVAGQERHQTEVDRRLLMNESKKYDFRAIGQMLAQLKAAFVEKNDITTSESYTIFCEYLQDNSEKTWDHVRHKFEAVIDPKFLYNNTRKLFEQRDSAVFLSIPIWGRIPVGEEILAVIETEKFQRLRGIKQLSFCEWAFPGAVHTRFEHSLGVLSAARKALHALASNKNFRSRFSEDQIYGYYLAALTHDIGHYPFAHMIEHYIASRAADRSDYARLRKVVSHSELSKRIVRDDAEIRSVLDRHWHGRIDSFLQVMSGQCDALSSVLDGPIDCDKIDYLKRDAHHCGISLAGGFSAEGIFAELTVSPNGAELLLKEQGIPNMEGFLISQSQMLSGVYWHPRIRAIVAMFHRFLDTVFGSDISDDNSKLDHTLQLLVDSLHGCKTERHAMEEIRNIYAERAGAEKTKALSLIDTIIQNRSENIYREIAKFKASAETPETERRSRAIYNSIFRSGIEYGASIPPINWKNVRRLRSSFKNSIERQLKPESIHGLDIIIDIPFGKNAQRALRVVEDDVSFSTISIEGSTHLKNSIFTDPAIHSAPIRVFVEPRLYYLLNDRANQVRQDAITQYLSELDIPESEWD